MNDTRNNLTGLRGFAAIWVVLLHFQRIPPLSAIDFGHFIKSGYLAVDIFFVLSGFILAHAYNDEFNKNKFWCLAAYKKFIFARFARIYPMHLVMMLIFFLFYGVTAEMGIRLRQGATEYTIWGALQSLLLLHGVGGSKIPIWNDPTWTLSVEAFAYIFLFWPGMWLVRHLRADIIIGLITFLWVALVVMSWSLPAGNLDMHYQWGRARILPEFLTGIWLRHCMDSQNKMSNFMATIFMLVGLSGIIILTFLPNFF